MSETKTGAILNKKFKKVCTTSHTQQEEIVVMNRAGPTYENAGAVIGAVTGFALGGIAPRLGTSYVEWNGGEGFVPGTLASMVAIGLFGLLGMAIGAGIGQQIPKRNT